MHRERGGRSAAVATRKTAHPIIRDLRSSFQRKAASYEGDAMMAIHEVETIATEDAAGASWIAIDLDEASGNFPAPNWAKSLKFGPVQTMGMSE